MPAALCGERPGLPTSRTYRPGGGSGRGTRSVERPGV